MNYNEYIEKLIEEKIKQKQAQKEDNTLNRMRNYSSKISKYGDNLSTVGKAIENNINNELAQKFGSTLANTGNAMSTGANSVSNTLNAPQKIFQGLTGTGATTAGTAAGTATGATAGAGAGATAAGTGAGAATGTAAGSAAAGASSGAAAGGAAGGAAAGSGASAGAAGGPIGALVALGVMALAGSHRKAAKKAGNAMMHQNEEMNNALLQEADEQQAQNQQALNNIVANSSTQPMFTGNSAPISDDVINNLSDEYGFLTGGASPVQNNNYAQENAPSLGYEGSATQEIAENRPKLGGVDAKKDSFISKLASGLGDFQKGYQENRYNGFAPENLTANQFATSKEIPNTQLEDYQQELTQSGKYTDKEIQDVAKGKNSGHKEIDEWIKNNPQAYNPTTTEVTYKNKGNMGRLGEFAGTVGRMAQNPLVKGAVATGVSALTGNPNPLLAGIGYASKSALSDVYNDVLKQNGIDIPTNALTQISGNDMRNVGNMLETKRYHDIWSDMRQQQLTNKKEYDDAMLELKRVIEENKKLQNEIKNRQTDRKIAIQQQNANTKAKGSGSKKASSKPTTKSDNSPSVADIISNASQPKNSGNKKKVYSF